MKLYAKTLSERASKGQGGNERLEIELYAFNKETPVGYILLTTDPDDDETWEIRHQEHIDDEWKIIAQGHKDTCEKCEVLED